MAPDRPGSVRLRYFLLGSTAVLAGLMILLLAINWQLRTDLNETRTRLTALEVKDVAEDASQRTAEVATCYASARGRPALSIILKLIAGLAADTTERQIVDEAINGYLMAAPTIEQCDKIARANGLDPKDFPPTTSRGETTR